MTDKPSASERLNAVENFIEAEEESLRRVYATHAYFEAFANIRELIKQNAALTAEVALEKLDNKRLFDYSGKLEQRVAELKADRIKQADEFGGIVKEWADKLKVSRIERDAWRSQCEKLAAQLGSVEAFGTMSPMDCDETVLQMLKDLRKALAEYKAVLKNNS